MLHTYCGGHGKVFNLGSSLLRIEVCARDIGVWVGDQYLQPIALQARMLRGQWHVSCRRYWSPLWRSFSSIKQEGYWLLSNAIFVTLISYVKRSLEDNRRACTWTVAGDFDSELEVLFDCMAREVIHVLYLFLWFSWTFGVEKAHNMLAHYVGPPLQRHSVCNQVCRCVANTWTCGWMWQLCASTPLDEGKPTFESVSCGSSLWLCNWKRWNSGIAIWCSHFNKRGWCYLPPKLAVLANAKQWIAHQCVHSTTHFKEGVPKICNWTFE